MAQQGENDCGLACLGMVLRYSGRYADAGALMNQAVSPAGLSLLELKRAATALGLSAICVRMDINALRSGKQPCILLVRNDSGASHFIVCYGAVRRRGGYFYQVADPARQVYYEPEKMLEKIWESRAALYFNDIVPVRLPFRQTPLGALLRLNLLPKELWTGIVLLNGGIMLLGLGISWVLEKALDNFFLTNRNGVILAVITMLLLVMLFKCLVTFLRQKLILILNMQINEQLVMRYISNFQFVPEGGSKLRLKAGLSDMQKIQLGLSTLAATVLSDGLLVLLIVSGLLCLQPVIAAANLLYLVAAGIAMRRCLPGFSFDYACLNQLSACYERWFTEGLQEMRRMEPEGATKHDMPGNPDYQRYLAHMKNTAAKLNRTILAFECLGAGLVVCVLAVGVRKMQEQAMSPATFMVTVILSYFLTMLVLKMHAAIHSVLAGGEAARKQSHFLFPDEGRPL